MLFTTNNDVVMVFPLLSTGPPVESLLTQAESAMDRYVSEESHGNLHEALMHINKAVCEFSL